MSESLLDVVARMTLLQKDINEIAIDLGIVKQIVQIPIIASVSLQYFRHTEGDVHGIYIDQSAVTSKEWLATMLQGNMNIINESMEIAFAVHHEGIYKGYYTLDKYTAFLPMGYIPAGNIHIHIEDQYGEGPLAIVILQQGN